MKNEETLIKEYELLGIDNDFLFCKVMEDPEKLSELIHRILPDLEFTDLTVVAQKAEKDGLDTHGVRFDIFVKDETGRAIEIEMQVINTGNLPLRIRFYSSMVDTQMLGPGESYSKLKDSYIIMICPFDHYKQGRHLYSFTYRCDQDPEIQLGDNSMAIVLNANGTEDDVSEGLKAFLDYVAGKAPADEYTKELDEAVKKARMNKEWRREYMTMKMRDLEHEEIGAARRDREMIERLLRKGKSPEEIVDLCDYPMELVREVEAGIYAMA